MIGTDHSSITFDVAENSLELFGRPLYSYAFKFRSRQLPSIIGLAIALGFIGNMMIATKLPLVFAFVQDGVEIMFVFWILKAPLSQGVPSVTP